MAKSPPIFESATETYSSVEILGEGGSGRVYRVQAQDGEEYALKCLSAASANSGKRKRFKNELDFCRKNTHPNIIQVVDDGLAILGGVKCPFYVMRRFPGTLRNLMVKGIAASNVLDLFSMILDGVEAAHLLAVTHRDLKPENVLHDPANNTMVVADFGIAHFEEDACATLVDTSPRERLANFMYAAPEQRVAGRTVDSRADIYALGLILNEMFTGSVPHGDGYTTIGSVSQGHAYLDAIVSQMIQQSPPARPNDIKTIKQMLIGHRNRSIALQELDAKRKQVIPVGTIPNFVPLNPMAVDWKNGTLYIELDRVPEKGWFQSFQKPRSNTSVMGSGPDNFRLSGKTLSVPAQDHTAQRVIDYARGYISVTNRDYPLEMSQAAAREQAELRQKLEIEQREIEKRARIVGSLKI